MGKNQIPRGAPGRQAPTPQGLRKAAGVLKPGQVVYFNGCKKMPKPNSEPFIFKGHGFGVFLGVVPQNIKEPGKDQMDALLAGIGWVSFENVFDLLGEEQFKLLETKFRAKYGLEEVPEGEAMPDAPAPRETPQILDARGRPIEKDEAPPEIPQ